MDTLKLGDIHVTEVIETDLNVPPTGMFRSATEEQVREQRQWLDRRFFDNQGNIIIRIRTYILRTPRHLILVDTCFGNGRNRPKLPQGHMLNTPYLQNLKAAGVSPEQVDYVFCTHLHLDHTGWNTRLENGRWVPTFPRAKYLFAKKDWDHFSKVPKDDMNRESIDDSVAPIVSARLHDLVDGDYAIDEGMAIEPLPGHTPGQMGLRIASRGRQAVFTGDMMHHPLQIGEPSWNIGVCTDPQQAIRTRRSFLERYADTGAVVLAAHFPGVTGGRVTSKGGKFRFIV